MTPSQVQEEVLKNIDRLLVPWLVGRSETYTMDEATRNIVATGYWLEEQFKEISDDDRRTQCWKFNRLSRTYDVWETAAECINEVLDGTVEKNRTPHRRWG
jgi:hypothetical protein